MIELFVYILFLQFTVGTIAALLQEIVNIYPMISPPNLNVSKLCFFSIEKKDLQYFFFFMRPTITVDVSCVVCLML